MRIGVSPPPPHGGQQQNNEKNNNNLNPAKHIPTELKTGP